MSSQNLCCSEHCTSNVTLLKQTFSSPDALLKSQTTTGELSSSDDVTSLVAYFGVRGAGRVHNEHNSHYRDAMRHHSCPSFHHHQWYQPDLLHHTPRPLLHAYCADPKRWCNLYCSMMRGRAGPADSMVWIWLRLILTTVRLGSRVLKGLWDVWTCCTCQL